MSDLPVLDPQPLRDLLEIGAMEGLVQELIELYREDVPGRVDLLNRAIGAGDVRRTMAESHGLKGALGNLGLVRFAGLVAALEGLAHEGRMEEARLLSAGLSTAFEEALGALSATFEQA